MLMSAPASCLLVVDIQERLAPKVKAPHAVIENAAVLLKVARRLDVPVLVSEQYPRGLGATVPELAALLVDGETIEKLHFSCIAEQGFADRFRGLGRPQAVVAGMEAHVCVLQTADDLLAGGTETFVVQDATSSRTECDHAAAMARLREAGARIVTTEMVVFEWLAKAGTPAFKELSPLIK
ncbi:MAG: hydrolase [Rhodospirillales bacterium]|nr:hydrolase [Rhodospirillales bacterium]